MPHTAMAHNAGFNSKETWTEVNGHDDTFAAQFICTQSPNNPLHVADNLTKQFSCDGDQTNSEMPAEDDFDGAVLGIIVASQPKFRAQSTCSDLLDDITSVIAADTGQRDCQYVMTLGEGQNNHGAASPSSTKNTYELKIGKSKRKSVEQNQQKRDDVASGINCSDDNNNSLGCSVMQSPVSYVSSNSQATRETDSPEATVQCENNKPPAFLHLNPSYLPINTHSHSKGVTNEHVSHDTTSPLSLVEKTEKMSLENDLTGISSQVDGSPGLGCQASVGPTRSLGCEEEGMISPVPPRESLRKQLSAGTILHFTPMSCGSDTSMEKSPGDADVSEQQVLNQTGAATTFDRQLSATSQGVQSTATCSSEGRHSQNLSGSSTLEARGGDELPTSRGERNDEYDLYPDDISLDGEGDYEELCSLELLDESIQSWDEFGEEELRSKGRGRKKTPKVVRPDKPRRLVPKVNAMGNRNSIPDSVVREFLYSSGQIQFTDHNYLPPTIPVTLEVTGPNLYEMRLCPVEQTPHTPTLAMASSAGGLHRKVSPNAQESVGSRRSPSPVTTRRSSPSSSRDRSLTPTSTGHVIFSNIGSSSTIQTLDDLSPSKAIQSRAFAASLGQQGSDNMWTYPRQSRLTSPVSNVLSQSSAASPSHATLSAVTDLTALTNDTRSSCGNLSTQYSPQPHTFSPPPRSQELGHLQSPTLFSSSQSIQMDGPIISRRDVNHRPQPYCPVQSTCVEQQHSEEIFLQPVNPPPFQQNTSHNQGCVVNTNCNIPENNSQTTVCPTLAPNTNIPMSEILMLFSPNEDIQQLIDNCRGPEALQSGVNSVTLDPTTQTFVSQAQTLDVHNVNFSSGNKNQNQDAIWFQSDNGFTEANHRTPLTEQPVRVQEDIYRLNVCSGGLLTSKVAGGEPVVPTVYGISGTPVDIEAAATKRKVSVSKSSGNTHTFNPCSYTTSQQCKPQANKTVGSKESSLFVYSTGKTSEHKAVREDKQNQMPCLGNNTVKDPKCGQGKGKEQICSAATNCAAITSPSGKMADIQSWINTLPSRIYFSDDSLPSLNPDLPLINATCGRNLINEQAPEVTKTCTTVSEQQSSCCNTLLKQVDCPNSTLTPDLLCTFSNNIDISVYMSSLESLEKNRGKKTSLDDYMRSCSSEEMSWLQDLLSSGRSKPSDPGAAQAPRDGMGAGLSPPPLARLSHKDVTDVLSVKDSISSTDARDSQLGSRVAHSAHLQGGPQQVPKQQEACVTSVAGQAQKRHSQQLQYCNITQSNNKSGQQLKFDGIQQAPIFNLRRDSQHCGVMNRFTAYPNAPSSNFRDHQVGPLCEAASPFHHHLAVLDPTTALQLPNQTVPITNQSGEINIVTSNPISSYPLELLPPRGPPSDIEMKSSSLTDPSVSNPYVKERLKQGHHSRCFTAQNPSETRDASSRVQVPYSEQQFHPQHYQQFDQTRLPCDLPPQQHAQLHWRLHQPAQVTLPVFSGQNVVGQTPNFPSPHVLEWLRDQQAEPATNTVMSLESISETQPFAAPVSHGPVNWQGENPDFIPLGFHKSSPSQHQQQDIYKTKILQLQQLQQQQKLYQQQSQLQPSTATPGLKLTKENLQNFQCLLQKQQTSSSHMGSTSNLSQNSHHRAALTQCSVAKTEHLIHDHAHLGHVGRHPVAPFIPQSSQGSNLVCSSQQRDPAALERASRRGGAASPSPSGGRSNRNSSPCPSSYRSRGCSPSPQQQGSRKTHHSPSPSPSSHRSGCHSPAPVSARSKSRGRSPSPACRSSKVGERAQRQAHELHRHYLSQDQLQQQHHKQQQRGSSSRINQWVIEQQKHQPWPLLDENPLPRGAPDMPLTPLSNKKSSATKTRKASNSSAQRIKSGTSPQDKRGGSLEGAEPITLSSGSDVGRLEVPRSSDVADVSVEISTSLSSGPENSDLEGDTVLHMLCVMEISLEQMTNIAESHLQFIDARGKRGETPLFVAVQSRRADVARLLLSHRANPNLLCVGNTRNSHTCLHEAVAQGDEEMVTLLLTPGHNTVVDPVIPSTGMTPLMLALELHTDKKKYRSIVKMLLDHGASLSAKDATGRTPLMFAIQSGDVALVEYMLRLAGADRARDLVSMTTKRGLNCLHFAAERKNLAGEEKRRLMRKIILAGGDPSHRNNEGDSARDWDRVNIEAVLADLRPA